MAFLYNSSFQVEGAAPILAKEVNILQDALQAIMDKISGPPVVTSEGRLYTKVPGKLKRCSKDLKSKYENIWEDTVVFYDHAKYGASSNMKDYFVWFGEFFSKPQPRLVVEKVFWHELLHIMLDLPKPFHHGKINDLIKYRIGLPGDPNPLGTVGLEC
jgi:hypothetical protein